MPKIIENLKSRILETTCREIKEKGYSGITLRGIAKSCDIALGTFYNYFKSKEILVANLIVADWMKKKLELEEELEKSTDVHGAMARIHAFITSFYNQHKDMWKDYRFTGESGYEYDERHQLLVSQISLIISGALQKAGCENDSNTCRVLAEMILTASTKDMDYEIYGPIIERVIRK